MKNTIQCKSCAEIIESKTAHDFVVDSDSHVLVADAVETGVRNIYVGQRKKIVI